MASLRRILVNVPRILVKQRQYSTHKTISNRLRAGVLCGSAVGLSFGAYLLYGGQKIRYSPQILAKEVEASDDDSSAPVETQRRAALQTARELRFLSFASVEYDGNIYMTPQDFLESVTEEAPRARTGRRRLNQQEVDKYLYYTPQQRKGTSSFFRGLNDKGLISYTEYLFLLCVLTKPHSGFRIAFNMFDTDGNQRVDKKEFLVLVAVFDSAFGSGAINRTAVMKYPAHRRQRMNLWEQNQTPLEDIIPRSQAAGDTRPQTNTEDGDVRKPPTDTTLAVHFFGRKGKDVLKYEDFHRFMDDLQTEVLEMEFHEFSRGMPHITEEEFAKVLLRYTILSDDETEEYLNRLQERIPEVQGISFADFRDFGQFLNNLDDFAIAMRLYTFNGKPINEEEFKRAVKAVTGHSLNPHVVHVVFQLFDQDGDGHLSHKEFISVMKDRLHRGFRSQTMQDQGRWDEFKACVKHNMKHGT